MNARRTAPSPIRARNPVACEARADLPPEFGVHGLPAIALRPGGSIAAVLQCRREQIARWGHTPEHDADKSLRAFLVDVRAAAQAAAEDHQFRHGHAQLRKRLVKLAALTLATIDRLDLEEPDHEA